MIHQFNGLKIIINDYVDDSIAVPKKRHHRPRIQKKWVKRFGYRTVIRPNIFKMHDHVVMSSRSFEQLRRRLGA
jgi:hypothetical protein